MCEQDDGEQTELERRHVLAACGNGEPPSTPAALHCGTGGPHQRPEVKGLAQYSFFCVLSLASSFRFPAVRTVRSLRRYAFSLLGLTMAPVRALPFGGGFPLAALLRCTTLFGVGLWAGKNRLLDAGHCLHVTLTEPLSVPAAHSLF
jgi:hypothetical protein